MFHTPLNRFSDVGGGSEVGPVVLALLSASGGVIGQGPLLIGRLSDSVGVGEEGPMLLALLSGGGADILTFTEETGPAELWAASLTGGVLPEWPFHVPLALLPYGCFNWGLWAERFPCAVFPVDPPSAPVALPAIDVTETSFRAIWEEVAGAESYRLDVSDDAGFGTFLPGYENLSVSGVTARVVDGLTAATVFYYRLRAVNAAGVSGSSNVIEVTTDPVPLDLAYDGFGDYDVGPINVLNGGVGWSDNGMVYFSGDTFAYETAGVYNEGPINILDGGGGFWAAPGVIQ